MKNLLFLGVFLIACSGIDKENINTEKVNARKSAAKAVVNLKNPQAPYLMAEILDDTKPVAEQEVCAYTASIYKLDKEITNKDKTLPNSVLFLKPANRHGIKVTQLQDQLDYWYKHTDKRKMLVKVAKNIAIAGVGVAAVAASGAAVVAAVPASSTILGPACHFISAAVSKVVTPIATILAYQKATEFKKQLANMVELGKNSFMVDVWPEFKRKTTAFIKDELKQRSMFNNATACKMYLDMPEDTQKRTEILAKDYGISVVPFKPLSKAEDTISALTTKKPTFFDFSEEDYLTVLGSIQSIDAENIEKSLAVENSDSAENAPSKCPVTLEDVGKILVF